MKLLTAVPNQQKPTYHMGDIFHNCQTRGQTISRSTLDATQVLSNSISISDSGGLDLSRHYNCFVPPPTTTTMKLFGVSQNILEYSRTFPNISPPPPTIPSQTIPNYTKLQAFKKLHCKEPPDCLENPFCQTTYFL